MFKNADAKRRLWLLRGGWGSAAALPHAGRFAANPPPAGEGGEHVEPLLSAIKWDSLVCN
jgi:hypothetical protein